MQDRLSILVPYYTNRITEDEEMSLRHLTRFLSDWDIHLVVPEGLEITAIGGKSTFQILHFPADYFHGTNTYSRLLLSRDFYKAFVKYEYILIHQMDCLVFSDDLDSFCAMNYDYIGAPLFEKDRLPPRMSRVGNGGLSLRRVRAFLDVLESKKIPSWWNLFTTILPDLKQFPAHKRWLKKIRTIRDARRGVRWYTQHYELNEDLFWSDRAKLFHPELRIAALDVALRFAFDAHPRVCFEKNGQHLPFGAHAWNKWDRSFWEPHLQA